MLAEFFTVLENIFAAPHSMGDWEHDLSHIDQIHIPVPSLTNSLTMGVFLLKSSLFLP